MNNDPKTLQARLPGEWFVGEQFERNGYQWEITVVLSSQWGFTTFEAQRLHPLERDAITSD